MLSLSSSEYSNKSNITRRMPSASGFNPGWIYKLFNSFKIITLMCSSFYFSYEILPTCLFLSIYNYNSFIVGPFPLIFYLGLSSAWKIESMWLAPLMFIYEISRLSIKFGAGACSVLAWPFACSCNLRHFYLWSKSKFFSSSSKRCSAWSLYSTVEIFAKNNNIISDFSYCWTVSPYFLIPALSEVNASSNYF
jgi:hypothetical protein